MRTSSPRQHHIHATPGLTRRVFSFSDTIRQRGNHHIQCARIVRTMAIKTLSERFAAPMTGSQVDRSAGIVRDVLLCGTTSANGRSYPWGKGLTCEPAKYEGRPVNCDHGTKATIDRKLGWLENVRVGSDGRPRADLHILKSHPMAGRVFEAAERRPSLFGLSHVAVCATHIDASGIEVIESIQSVESVDLVADPATTRGLYESKTMKRKLTQFLEAIAPRRPAAGKWAKSKRLQEMDDMMADGVDMPAPEEIGDGADDIAAGITEAFRAALSSIIDGALTGGTDAKEALSKIKKMLAAHGDINGDGKVDAADIDAADEPDGDEMPAFESKSGKYFMGVLDTLTKAGLKVTRESVTAVGSIPEANRDGVLKLLSESVKPAETPRTTTRTDTKTLVEHAEHRAGGDATAKPPTAATVAESITGR